MKLNQPNRRQQSPFKYLKNHISMQQKGKHNIKISSGKKTWQVWEELGSAFNRLHGLPYSLQTKMEKFYTVSKNKTRS